MPVSLWLQRFQLLGSYSSWWFLYGRGGWCTFSPAKLAPGSSSSLAPRGQKAMEVTTRLPCRPPKCWIGTSTAGESGETHFIWDTRPWMRCNTWLPSLYSYVTSSHLKCEHIIPLNTPNSACTPVGLDTISELNHWASSASQKGHLKVSLVPNKAQIRNRDEGCF